MQAERLLLCISATAFEALCWGVCISDLLRKKVVF